MIGTRLDYYPSPTYQRIPYADLSSQACTIEFTLVGIVQGIDVSSITLGIVLNQKEIDMNLPVDGTPQVMDDMARNYEHTLGGVTKTRNNLVGCVQLNPKSFTVTPDLPYPKSFTVTAAAGTLADLTNPNSFTVIPNLTNPNYVDGLPPLANVAVNAGGYTTSDPTSVTYLNRLNLQLDNNFNYKAVITFAQKEVNEATPTHLLSCKGYATLTVDNIGESKTRTVVFGNTIYQRPGDDTNSTHCTYGFFSESLFGLKMRGGEQTYKIGVISGGARRIG